MKEFMMIFVGGDYESSDISPQEFQTRMNKWNAWIEDLKNEQLFLEGRALKNAATRVEGSHQVITDGPFVETKELITGYLIIKARDLEHATSLTDKYPDYDLEGKVEIREIQTF